MVRKFVTNGVYAMYFKSLYAKPLIKLNDLISTKLRFSWEIARFLFGVNVTQGNRSQYCDYFTKVP
ncbi:MAG TPA: hypothetical protein DCF68_13290 [Cyanothece sp. UBA12306]|nr:hypothetical protein [Cyanothece sp. UBA12306]